MKKKDYEKPVVEIIEFDLEDSIATSGVDNFGSLFGEEIL